MTCLNWILVWIELVLATAVLSTVSCGRRLWQVDCLCGWAFAFAPERPQCHSITQCAESQRWCACCHVWRRAEPVCCMGSRSVHVTFRWVSRVDGNPAWFDGLRQNALDGDGYGVRRGHLAANPSKRTPSGPQPDRTTRLLLCLQPEQYCSADWIPWAPC
jgi:hypothetical protein